MATTMRTSAKEKRNKQKWALEQVSQCRAWCKQTGKQFGPPTFRQWDETVNAGPKCLNYDPGFWKKDSLLMQAARFITFATLMRQKINGVSISVQGLYVVEGVHEDTLEMSRPNQEKLLKQFEERIELKTLRAALLGRIFGIPLHQVRRAGRRGLEAGIRQARKSAPIRK